MKKCILKGVDLVAENDSLAHVIPSALGGRLRAAGILCEEANTELNEKCDSHLIEAFRSFMLLIGGSKDKSSKTAPIFAVSDSGERFQIGKDKVIPAAPEYIEEQLSDGTTRVTAKARTRKELKNLLGRAKKDLPTLDIDEIVKEARIESEPLPLLRFEMQIGPISTFPAVFAMASVFSAYKNLDVHPGFKKYLQSISAESRPMPPDTFYFISNRLWLSVPVTCNCIVLICDPKRKESLFFAQFFGQPGVAVVLPYEGDTQQCFSYAIDVESGQMIEPKVKWQRLLKLEWKETHKNGDPSLWKEVEKAGQKFLSIVHEKSRSREIRRLMDLHFTGPVITQDGIDGFSKAFAEMAAQVIKIEE